MPRFISPPPSIFKRKNLKDRLYAVELRKEMLEHACQPLDAFSRGVGGISRNTQENSSYLQFMLLTKAIWGWQAKPNVPLSGPLLANGSKRPSDFIMCLMRFEPLRFLLWV